MKCVIDGNDELLWPKCKGLFENEKRYSIAFYDRLKQVMVARGCYNKIVSTKQCRELLIYWRMKTTGLHPMQLLFLPGAQKLYSHHCRYSASPQHCDCHDFSMHLLPEKYFKGMEKL